MLAIDDLAIDNKRPNLYLLITDIVTGGRIRHDVFLDLRNFISDSSRIDHCLDLVHNVTDKRDAVLLKLVLDHLQGRVSVDSI